MWSHVADDRLMDVLEGVGTPADRAHASRCEACRARLAEAGDALAAITNAPVPEPSPLYWESLRSAIARRQDEAPAPARRGLLAPALLAAAAVLASLSVLPVSQAPVAPALQTVVPPPQTVVAAWTALPGQDEDTGFQVLQGLEASPSDIAGAGACVAVDACVAELSDEESRALADLLRDEIAEGNVL